MRRSRFIPFRILAFGLAAMLVATGVGTAQAGGQPQERRGQILNRGAAEAIDGQYIVVLQGETSRARRAEVEVASQARTLLGRYGGRADHVYTTVLRGFAADMTEAQAERLAADPAVKYVQQSLTVRIADAGTQPNPPSWGLDRIDGTSDSAYNYPGAGTGVTAYVLDTGVRFSHETFEGRASSGYDFVDEDADAQDCNGHGTHTAGTVGGEEFGVAKDVTLVAVRVLGCDGNAPDRDTIEGLDWTTQNAKLPAIGNMSLTSGGANAEPEAMREATKRAIAAGVQFSIAAGNSGADACGTAPGDTPEAITLGSTDSNDSRSGFSNYGSCLDLFAPGGNITSASHSSDTGQATMSGTSMAAPHAAGAAALYLEAHPDASGQEVRDAVVSAAQSGVVGNAGSGSPNLLLNVTGLD